MIHCTRLNATSEAGTSQSDLVERMMIADEVVWEMGGCRHDEAFRSGAH